MNNTEILKFSRSIGLLYEQTISRALENTGLTQLELDILAFLHNYPEMDTASHIVEYRMLPKANVSQAVDSLTRKELLVSRRDECDRRRFHLTPTENAGPIIEKILAAQQAFRDLMFVDFTETERELYNSMTMRISENAKKQLEKK
ncbi:MAG: MarR family transcriptional regulator [Clostridia bacterium]|nr:MarR family transcriptional regulator [Clostridia bacterium]